MWFSVKHKIRHKTFSFFPRNYRALEINPAQDESHRSPLTADSEQGLIKSCVIVHRLTRIYEYKNPLLFQPSLPIIIKHAQQRLKKVTVSHPHGVYCCVVRNWNFACPRPKIWARNTHAFTSRVSKLWMPSYEDSLEPRRLCRSCARLRAVLPSNTNIPVRLNVDLGTKRTYVSA